MKKLFSNRLMSLAMALIVFLILNMPSVKLIYSSSLINILALGGLWGLGLTRIYLTNAQEHYFSQLQFSFILHLFAIWLLMFWKTWLLSPGSFSARELLQYISVILFATGIAIFVHRSDFKYIFIFQVIWGSILSVVEATIGINKNANLGQNYLTSGVAIATTIVLVFGYILSKEKLTKYKLALLPVLGVLYIGITSLRGRAPILLSFIVPILIIILSVCFKRGKVKKLLFFLYFPLLIIGTIFIMVQIMPGSTVDRILRIFSSIQDEPRLLLYNNSLELILNNLFGLGLTGQIAFDITYPHNIFLEMAMAGGFIVIILFISLLVLFIKYTVRSVKEMDNSVMWLAIGIYLFLTWNISYELSSSYMLFSSFSLYVVSIKEPNYLTVNNNALNYD